MSEKPEITPDGKELVPNIFYRVGEGGGTETDFNNLWMTLLTAPAGDPSLSGQMKGAKIAETISDPEQRARFEGLSQELGEVIPWKFSEGDERRQAICSPEANEIIKEMYEIAIASGWEKDALCS